MIFLPIIFMGIVMELLLRNIPNDYKLKKEYLDSNSNEIETLILGSSHSFYGLNPQYFLDRTFNASYISQTLKYDLEILKKYENDFRRLKTIVLPISYFSLYSSLEDEAESWRIKDYTIYHGIKSSKSLSAHSELFSHQFNINIKRIISHYLFDSSFIASSNLGWGINYSSGSATDLFESGNNAAKRHTKNIDSEKYKEIFYDNSSIFEAIIQWCKVNDVRIIIVIPPTFETYRNNLNPDQFEKSISITHDICLNYANCKFFNLHSDLNFNAKDYYDADHLSEIGAEKLSIFINNSIIEWQ
jgi:hypothetical protein